MSEFHDLKMIKPNVQAVQERAKEDPQAVAFLDPKTTLTRHQLDAAAQALAVRLQNFGLGADAVLAWLGPIDASAVSAYLAVQYIGAAIVVPDPGMDDARLREALQNVNVKAILCATGALDRAKALSDQPPILHSVSATSHRLEAVFTPCPDLPDRVSNIRFTSGSTGTPKAIAITRGTSLHFDGLLCDMAKMTSADTMVLLGHMWGVMAALASGCKVVAFDVRQMGTAALADWMQSEKVTILNTYTALVRELVATGQKFPDLRYIKIGGERLTQTDIKCIAEAVPNDAILDAAYGAMEYPIISAYRQRLDQAVHQMIIPFGTPTPGVEVQIVDDAGVEVSRGETGEILLCSDFLPNGYLVGSPEAQARFRTNPSGRRTFRTGDFAMRDTDGILHPKGRQNLRVKVRGYRVGIEDVEAVIGHHPDVHDVTVAVVNRNNGHTTLDCHYVGDVLPGDFKAYAASALPNYMVPHRWIKHQSLPKTPTGKPDRRGVAKLTVPRAPQTRDWTNDREATIAQLMQEALPPVRISRDDDFFDLGGDSLLAMRLVLRIEEVIGLRLPFESLVLEGASVAAIAKRVDQAARSSVVDLKKGTGALQVMVMPSESGHLSDYLEVMHAFDPAISVTGIRPSGILSGRPDSKISHIAARAFADDTAAIPDAVVGYSFGAMIAAELIRRYAEKGVTSPSLILIDPFAAWLDRKRWLRHIFRAFAQRGAYAGVATASSFAKSTLGIRSNSIDSAHKFAMLSYKPHSVHPETCLVLTTEQTANSSDVKAWKALLGGGVESRVMPGNHLSMMRGENAIHVAETVSKWLATTRRG